MSLRVVFETPDGVRIERAQKAMAAADWAADLQARYNEALVRARIPNETQRLASVVDVAAATETAAQVACPREVRKGAVTRVVQDHLLQIAGRAPGANDDPYYGWASDPAVPVACGLGYQAPDARREAGGVGARRAAAVSRGRSRGCLHRARGHRTGRAS